MQEKKIIYKTEVIKSNLCDYNNTYILVRDDITIIGHNVTQAAFKNCTPFTKCITYTDGTTIDDAEDLDLVMLMYNLLEYSSNYSDTCSSWFNSKDKAIDFADIANNDNVKSLQYKAKLLGGTVTNGLNGVLRDTAIAVL